VILKLIDKATGMGARAGKAADVFGISERSVQRWRSRKGGDLRRGPSSQPSNKLSAEERENVLKIANSKGFRDLSPKQFVPLMADKGQYVASESTFYRILREEDLVKHREPSRPPSPRPQERLATGPCQLWSWDITYLKSLIRGQFFYLYLFMDIWSRKIVAAEVFLDESSDYSAQLFADTCRKYAIDPDTLTLHADNGGPMKGSTMLATLQNLGVVPSFSRPRVSDDNPFSESLFRTLKYRPEYPSVPFASLEEARNWVSTFVNWYNTEHLHSSLRFVTPDDRHFGREENILLNRQRVYGKARLKNPNRWAKSLRNWEPVGDVCLNPKSHQEGYLKKVA
jgi:transposase InsO family protein